MGNLVRVLGFAILSLMLSLEAVPNETPAALPFPLASPKYEVTLEKSRMVPMHDGVQLSTDVYLPIGAGDRLPVILIRTPYNKNTFRREISTTYPGVLFPARYFASQGYVVVVQDVRGKFESEGEYLFAGNDTSDGYDTTQWAATQPWSNGKVGGYGCSYLGEVQYQQAIKRNPHLAALIPQGAGPVQYRAGGGIKGGALELATMVGWVRDYGSKLYYRPPPATSPETFLNSAQYFRPAPMLPDIDYASVWNTLPVVDMMKKASAPPTDWVDIVSRDFSDSWWSKTDFIRPSDKFDVPALHINSWYDYGVGETLRLFNQMRVNAVSQRARDNQYIIISPTTHCRSEISGENTFVGQREMGNPSLDYFKIYLGWFDYWLKGNEAAKPSLPKVQLFVMGKNQWRGENEWPLARTVFTKYYLHADGRANSRYGSGFLSTTLPQNEPPDHYTYDPAAPVPTAGGAMCKACVRSSAPADGSVDQRDVEARDDVLVYTTEPLPKGIEITGPIELTLYVSSSAKDTDFTAKLVDVYPDGTAFNLQEGILRARYREGFEKKVWMKPGEVYAIRIDLHATSNYFPAQHRIRLEVSSSSFPRWDRNLNTGGNNYDETNWISADNVIRHSAATASYLLLPVIPGDM
jgi:putative CocE/NonD family hydrolase